jgi:hypothetical protein
MNGKLVTENIGVPKGSFLGHWIPRTRVALPTTLRKKPVAFFGVEGYLRICAGVPADALREGLSRVDAFMGRLG